MNGLAETHCAFLRFGATLVLSLFYTELEPSISMPNPNNVLVPSYAVTRALMPRPELRQFSRASVIHIQTIIALSS